jgi:hypothetical protein
MRSVVLGNRDQVSVQTEHYRDFRYTPDAIDADPIRSLPELDSVLTSAQHGLRGAGPWGIAENRILTVLCDGYREAWPVGTSVLRYILSRPAADALRWSPTAACDADLETERVGGPAERASLLN